MSTTLAPDILRAELRNAVENEHVLTHEQIAAELGVSLRTLVYWLNADVVPQKRYRLAIAEWLSRRAA